MKKQITMIGKTPGVGKSGIMTDLELLERLYEISKTSDCHYNLTNDEYDVINEVEKRINEKNNIS